MSTSDREEKPDFVSQTDIDSFVKHLNRSKRILELCGAGLSAPSCIPTFTNEGAMWKNHKAVALSNIKTFVVKPGLTWEYSANRRSLALKAKPNKAHLAFAKTVMKKSGMVCITQNVDSESWRVPRSLRDF
jgi:NAD-dependent SIR2 family protein deacetylase